MGLVTLDWPISGIMIKRPILRLRNICGLPANGYRSTGGLDSHWPVYRRRFIT